MKARYLKKLLNDTSYLVADRGDCIALGSPMCLDLISVDKKTLKMQYALDWEKKGRDALVGRKAELLFIWDKLDELIKSGEIKAIIEENDTLDNPMEVWLWDNEKFEAVKKFTDAFGWPNVTHDGKQLYEDFGWPTRREALEKGLRSVTTSIEWRRESIEEIQAELNERQERLRQHEDAKMKIEAELEKENEVKG